MLISKCPRCDEAVRLPIECFNLTDSQEDTPAECPWCRGSFSLAEVLELLPPALIVASLPQPPTVAPPELEPAHAAADATESELEAMPWSDESGIAETGEGDAFSLEGIPDAFGSPGEQSYAGESAAAVVATKSGRSSRRRKKKWHSNTILQSVVGIVASVPIAAVILSLIGNPLDLGFWPFDGSNLFEPEPKAQTSLESDTRESATPMGQDGLTKSLGNDLDDFDKLPIFHRDMPPSSDPNEPTNGESNDHELAENGPTETGLANVEPSESETTPPSPDDAEAPNLAESPSTGDSLPDDEEPVKPAPPPTAESTVTSAVPKDDSGVAAELFPKAIESLGSLANVPNDNSRKYWREVVTTFSDVSAAAVKSADTDRGQLIGVLKDSPKLDDLAAKSTQWLKPNDARRRAEPLLNFGVILVGMFHVAPAPHVVLDDKTKVMLTGPLDELVDERRYLFMGRIQPSTDETNSESDAKLAEVLSFSAL